MTAQAIQWHTWELADDADRRFQRLLLLIALPVLLIALIVPFLDLVGLTRGGGTLTGQQFVELINDREEAEVAETVEEAAPAEEAEPDPVEPEPAEAETQPEPEPAAPAVPQPTVAPAPTPDPAVLRAQEAAAARQRAQEQAKVFDQLNALRSDTLTGIDAAQPLTSASSVVGTAGGSGSGSGTTANIADSARQGSGGISGQGVGNTRRTDAGTGLGKRNTTVIESPVGFGEDRTQPGQGGDKVIPGRTLEEIQLAFDRNKGAITAIINRALRTNPNLRGKIVVSFTVMPDGSMSKLTLVRSELGDADVEQRVMARIGLINFGPKNVPPFDVKDYPIVLL